MSDMKNYVEGQRFVCPKCKMKSVVKIKHELKDFKIVSSYPICAFCHCRLDTLETQAERYSNEKTARAALDSLFGADSHEEQQQRQSDERLKDSLQQTKTRFCRDCRHYIHHPFLSRCELHHKSVEPMDDCPNFSPLSLHDNP